MILVLFIYCNNIVIPRMFRGRGGRSTSIVGRLTPLNKVKCPIEGRDLWEGQYDEDIVLWREQGIGDELIFLGLVPEARDLLW